MGTVAQLLEQRSQGEAKLRFGPQGVRDLREAGCSKLRLPHRSSEAILINTSGGLAGGDEISVALNVEAAALAVTTQAAERVYRSLGPPARLQHDFTVERGGELRWLPQETILFDGAALERTMRVNLHGQASFMALETLVFGREAMGETVQAVKVQDSWDIYRDGTLIHAERLALGPSLPQGNATLGAAKALATFLMIAPEVEKLGAAVAEAAGEYGAVSCWNGKLVARLLASDGFNLRKAALRVIAAALAGEAVPKTWTM